MFKGQKLTCYPKFIPKTKIVPERFIREKGISMWLKGSHALGQIWGILGDFRYFVNNVVSLANTLVKGENL